MVRCIGIYFPMKMQDKPFRNKLNIFIVSAWILAFAPHIPVISKSVNRYGLECKTRKCTVLPIDYYGCPSVTNIKIKTGELTALTCIVLLIVLNGSIYLQLRVSLSKIVSLI